ncbi:hypothetical protein BC937DRAFT_94194 [Endogone sp. FLAS-F59071]|nr:hypothetical protein BC937DRAFT_94194 [Endogone sp. FLAS-F59071]|eukprot:RUS20848.1 hypothetical protein BC937DRAFT_94194 [Endogone sp. FLAS-F59071]
MILTHLWHPRPALGTLVPNHRDDLLPFLKFFPLECLDECLLAVEHPGFSLKLEPLFARDLGDGACWREAAAQNLYVTGRLDGIVERTDDVLPCGYSRKKEEKKTWKNHLPWLQISQERNTVANGLEIINRQVDADRTRNSNQVEHGVCGA